MRIVICDDELLIREQIERYLIEFFSNHSLEQPEYAFFGSGDELLMCNDQVDIAFLDVEMPGRSGIIIGKQLMERNPNCLVFIVSAHMDYLDEAMEFRVFRYLSKPLDKNRLFRNMNQAIVRYRNTCRQITIQMKEKALVINESDIISIEAREKKIYIYTVNGQFESTQKMSFWIEKLNAGCFFQTHRSFIVNMKYVSAYDDSLVYLCDGSIKAYLTRRKYKEFKERHLLYMEEMG